MNPFFKEYLLQADVLCLTNYKNYIIAGALLRSILIKFLGIGGTLLVYQPQGLKFSQSIFLDERIHNLYIKNDYLIIKGGKQLSLVKWGESENKVSCISQIQCSDWIEDVVMLKNNLIGLVTAHNSFETWDLFQKEKKNTFHFSERCILYSCKIVECSSSEAIIFAGTVFGEILIWSPFLNGNKNLLHRLKGHNGAVFSIEVNISKKILATTSDDRSLRIWTINTLESLSCLNEWKNIRIEILHVLYCHTARVWRSLIIDEFFISAGEDSQLIIWRKDGTLLKSLSLHQDGGIRGLHFLDSSNLIATGGEDGGINTVSWHYLISESNLHHPKKIIKPDKNFSNRVCFIKTGFVFTSSGCCTITYDNYNQSDFVYKNENFVYYCLLEVSSEGNYIVLGSIKGHIVVIDVETQSAIIDKKYFNGRIYSIHCLDNHILACGPEGKLVLWKYINKSLTSVKELLLPTCKERWTTCALLLNENLLIGDRMGNINIYNLQGDCNPIFCFKKIHSYLGVTDMMIEGKTVFSIGRDGVLKSFSSSYIHLSSNKLPIEWPWKMIKYKNDKLILGFQGVNFVVWSYNYREIIASLDCSGGHRSCHFKLNNDTLKFIYIKENKIFEKDLILNAIKRLRSGFHSKNINTLKILETDQKIIVSGSEDTTMRISLISGQELKVLKVFKTHVSSIRAIEEIMYDTNNFIIFSAGGKGQIIIWKFDIKSLECEQIINHKLEERDRHWKNSVPVAEPDTRFMCISVIKTKDEYFIAAGCSDCQIRVFLFKKELTLLCSVNCSYCILKITILKVLSKLYIVCMLTDGNMIFWLLTDNFTLAKLNSFRLHQSGINCFAFIEIENGKYFVITGGDDNKICASEVRINENKLQLKELWSNSNVHSCQITGAKIIKNILITASIDQRITLWKWSFLNNEYKIEYLNQHMTSIPDVQGIDAKLCSDNKITLTVYGKGLEVLEIGISSIIS